MHKAARYIFKGEIVAILLVIIGGFLDPAVWLFGILTSIPIIIIILIFLFIARSYYDEEVIRYSFKKMIWANLLFLVPGAITIVGLTIAPIGLNIG